VISSNADGFSTIFVSSKCELAPVKGDIAWRMMKLINMTLVYLAFDGRQASVGVLFRASDETLPPKGELRSDRKLHVPVRLNYQGSNRLNPISNKGEMDIIILS